MPFTKTAWNEGASPGISAAELNRIETGIEDAHIEAEYVEGSTEVATVILTASLITIASVSLTIPTFWNTWDAVGWASYAIDGDSSPGGGGDRNSRYEALIRVDGTDQQTQLAGVSIIGSGSSFGSGGVGGRRTGLTATGSRIVARLRARSLDTATTTMSLEDIFLYGIARRAT